MLIFEDDVSTPDMVFYLSVYCLFYFFFFFQAEDGIRDVAVTGVQTCALPISLPKVETMQPQPISPYGVQIRRRALRRGISQVLRPRNRLPSLLQYFWPAPGSDRKSVV